MKKTLLIAALLLVLSGCGSKPVEGEVFDGAVNDYDGVTMTIVDGTASRSGVTVEVLNTTDADINSGNEIDCGLQVEKDGQWYWLEAGDYVNTSEAYFYIKDEPRELVLRWNSRYGKLEPGHYRVTKWFFEFIEPGNTVDFLLACEFTLE